MVDLQSLCDDLVAEYQVLDAIVAPLHEDEWRRPTPAPGWTVRDQIAHLGMAEDLAALAVVAPAKFKAAQDAGAGSGEKGGRPAASPSGLATLASWRRARERFVEAARAVDPATRVPWFGPSMSPASKVTARLMETWAHGQDVADGLGVRRQPTARLRHIALLGVRTRDFAYANDGRQRDETPVRVELSGPGGEVWRWGLDDTVELVRGDIEDFCLVVTRRRHVDDTDLDVRGEAARHWMLIAQAYVGPPGPGRPPIRSR